MIAMSISTLMILACIIETCSKFYCKKSKNKYIYVRSILHTVQLKVLYSTTNVSNFTQFWASIAFVIFITLFTILFVIYKTNLFLIHSTFNLLQGYNYNRYLSHSYI